MSGIFGLYQRQGAPADLADLTRMAASLEALGRDGTSSTGTERVRLGHVLMDRGPAGRVPCRALERNDSGLHLAGDLRLDNRVDLTSQLGISGHEAKTASDSTLVLKAYERWGVDCLGHLLGDFAFAIWDQKMRRLFLARDHFGIRPLFYSTVGSSFFFASAIRGLLVHTQIPRDLNEFMVARYLICPCDSGGPTFYKSIHSLLPSHCLVIEADGEPRLIRYWEPDPDARVFFKDDRGYVERFRELLTEAVRTRVDSTARVGIQVSGGLDSASITAVAMGLDGGSGLVGVGHVTEPSSPAADLDERHYLEALKDSFPELDLRYVTAAGASPLDAVEQVFDCLRLPVQAGLNYVHKALFEASREAGCGVLLSGIGGDEVASAKAGSSLAGLFRSLELGGFAREFAAERELRNISGLRLWRRVLAAQLPRPVWQVVHYLRHGYWGYYRTSLRKDMARDVDLRAMLNAGAGWWEMTGYVPPSPRMELYETIKDMSSDGVDNLNLATEAADYGLSLRFPLADLRLVEYCLAIPAHQRRRDGVGRLLMRTSMEPLLPDVIRLRRDKCVFGPDYLLRIQADLARIERAVTRFGTNTTFARYIDLDRVDRTVERISRADLSTPDASWDCLSVLLPAYYLGRFLELECA